MALDLPVLDVGVSPRVVRAHGWVVATRCGGQGVVHLVETRGGLRLEIGDAASDDRRTLVDLRPGGAISVYASTTPPALLVGAADARTVPALPGGAETARLDAGQRLLVLSSDALDALPVSLAAVLQSLPARLADREPHELLRELTADLDGGSAAIVVRQDAHQPRSTTDHEPRPTTRDTEEATWGSAVRS